MRFQNDLIKSVAKWFSGIQKVYQIDKRCDLGIYRTNSPPPKEPAFQCPKEPKKMTYKEKVKRSLRRYQIAWFIYVVSGAIIDGMAYDAWDKSNIATHHGLFMAINILYWVFGICYTIYVATAWDAQNDLANDKSQSFWVKEK
jgi:hypothetical protein